VFYVDRMIGRRGIEIRAAQLAAFSRFGVIVFEPKYPFPLRSTGSPPPDRRLNFGYGPKVTIDLPAMAKSGIGDVRVRVDESGDDGFSAQV
jgi:hypothetical protein